MKKFTFQFLALLVVIAIGIYSYKYDAIPNIPTLTNRISSQSFVVINNKKIKVEVADSREERTKGLGGRESLASDSGMLFIFDNPERYPFWMKGLKFPLDFIWIREGKVVDIIENAKPPKEGQTDDQLPIYLPRVDVDSVLEVNEGIAKSLNVRLGDEVKRE